ncbi:caspase family protein [Bacteroidales bacterium OttesenSCG-928-K03]|nr:caspase family protein [Odoribacter sp. OttesenSCG-928-L07]MDL2242930.1 caspase family protein [Bacteroidales bacterium OttesenSCG-928-K03]
MKRRAILIGNTNGLQGVSVDLQNYKNFLKSKKGGAWLDNEITIIENKTEHILMANILNIRIKENPDFVFLVFSGHGGCVRNKTILELKENEFIDEGRLLNIAKRQITIVDCCRGVDSEQKGDSIEMFASGGTIGDKIRQLYDDRIMKSDKQQVIIYSCSIGETSIDTGLSGGLYTKNLLEAINNISFEDYLTINHAHEIAAKNTTEEAIKLNHNQNPDSRVVRCFFNRQLIIAINPKVCE